MKDRLHQGCYQPRTAFRPLFTIVAILAACAALMLWAGQWLQASGGNPEARGDLSARFTQAPTVTYQGAQYLPKTGLTTLLVMGIDHASTEPVAQNTFRNGGQADFLLLMVIDDAAKTITPIHIDRDTMAEVTVLGILGNITGTRTTQICLSHGFGDGGAQSCQLTRDAVSRLLLGVDIQFYFALDLDGIAPLNDALGGVSVTLADDFTVLDAAMAQGATLTLRGKQAEYYVRNRFHIGTGTNEARMLRQQTYWDGLAAKITQKMRSEGNASFIGELFDLLTPYLQSDMKRGRLMNEAWFARDYAVNRTQRLLGGYQSGTDGFVEFHADEPALEALVMRTFYNVANE